MQGKPAGRNGFDKLAACYRWLEYMSFGPLLWQVRTAQLRSMRHATRALVLGDGDGRFTAALLRNNPRVQVFAVDASAGMLKRLERLVCAQGDGARVVVHHADALKELPSGPFDLVCTHFFLDCFSDAECEALVSEVASRLVAESSWIVSEFAVPSGALRRPARILIAFLYAVFRGLTGMRARRLPDYPAAMTLAGLRREATLTRLGGTLRSEMWRVPPTNNRRSGKRIE